MSLEKVLSISGKPGLYKLTIQTRSGFLAESLVDGKKLSVSARENISLLSEIAIYTLTEELPLREVFLKISENAQISSILDYEIPYYFTMKLNDINMIIGQQQLESLNSILNLLKNKNKDDRSDIMKKTNIQKAVSWCEKYKIPCNKFTEKTNMFLPVNKEDE